MNNDNQYFVYILQYNDKTYYVGITNDLERRLHEHQNGLNSKAYTFYKRPLNLVFYEKFNEVNQAIAFEKQVKGWRKEKKEALINGKWELLPKLSKTAKNNKYLF